MHFLVSLMYNILIGYFNVFYWDFNIKMLLKLIGCFNDILMVMHAAVHPDQTVEDVEVLVLCQHFNY